MYQRSLYYFWPGLPHLWLQGNLTGLAVAISFSLLGNSLLLLTFVWRPESGTWVIWLGWLSFVIGWVVAVRRQLRQPVSSLVSPPADSALSDQLLLEAQRAYLGRQWSTASRIVDDLINENSGDVESRLLRVAIQRRSGNVKGAKSELSTVTSLDEAETWQYEIDVEQRLLTELESADSNESSEDDQFDSERSESDSASTLLDEENAASRQITSYDSTYSRPESALTEQDLTESIKPDQSADAIAETQRETDRLPNSDQQTNNSTSISADGDPRHSSRHAA